MFTTLYYNAVEKKWKTAMNLRVADVERILKILRRNPLTFTKYQIMRDSDGVILASSRK